METITKVFFVVEREFVPKEHRDIFASYSFVPEHTTQIIFSEYVAMRLMERHFHYRTIESSHDWNFSLKNCVSIGLRKVTVKHPLFQ